MFPAGTRLDASAPIAVLEPFRAVNRALLELLAGFGDEDWARPTVHRDRTVKDLTAHLLQGSLSRVSMLRDGYRPAISSSSPASARTTAGPIASREELVAFIQRGNREFMQGMRRVSPVILRELIARYDEELMSAFERLDPEAPGLGVVWAGEWVSANWFDVAREYSEKWHHQQQLRDATGRTLLDDPALLEPALETFARALPHAYRKLASPAGTALSIALGSQGLGWTLRREAAGWSLFAGVDSGAPTTINLTSDLAWRLWTNGISRDLARGGIQVVGDAAAAEPLLSCLAIMA